MIVPERHFQKSKCPKGKVKTFPVPCVSMYAFFHTQHFLLDDGVVNGKFIGIERR